MSQDRKRPGFSFGAEDLRLPDELRAPFLKHLGGLREKYLERDWGAWVGWGSRPALLDIDMDLGDVTPVDDDVRHLAALRG